ncbi:MAG TPA: hypothetical protein VH593_04890 [Ktedonobacteraceae bacterium]|jgi:hypothetical protein
MVSRQGMRIPEMIGPISPARHRAFIQPRGVSDRVPRTARGKPHHDDDEKLGGLAQPFPVLAYPEKSAQIPSSQLPLLAKEHAITVESDAASQFFQADSTPFHQGALSLCLVCSAS